MKFKVNGDVWELSTIFMCPACGDEGFWELNLGTSSDDSRFLCERCGVNGYWHGVTDPAESDWELAAILKDKVKRQEEKETKEAEIDSF